LTKYLFQIIVGATSDTRSGSMDVDQLLTTTARRAKHWICTHPSTSGVIRDCLRIGMQAANGSNQQSWRWLVISDSGLRDKIAALYRDAYLAKVGGQFIAELLGEDTAGGRLMSSTEWLVQNLAKVPLLVIPCYEPYIPRTERDDSFFAATMYGSIFPAVWNFQLALHSRGYGTCVTTLHLAHEQAVRELLGIPDTYVQGCLLPVARLRAGLTFRAASRRPIAEVVAVDTWEGQPL
jgi:nitroreductase